MQSGSEGIGKDGAIIDVHSLTAREFDLPMIGVEHSVSRPDGAKLRVVVAGDGPRTAFMEHGFGMSADVWRFVAADLCRKGFRVVAYDRRAHGKSTNGSKGLTSAALREDIKAMAEEFKVEDAILVCHSMGNFIALGALTDPEFSKRFTRAVLVSPTTGNSAKGAPMVRFSVPLMKLGVMQTLSRSRILGARIASMQVGHKATPAMVEATRQTMIRIPRDLTPLSVVTIDESVEDDLPTVALPLHVLSGTDDLTTPGWHASLIVERAPNARVDYIEGVGHMFPWEVPEVVVQAVVGV